MAFLLRRLMFYLAAFIAAATVNFFLPRLMPGDPIQKMFAGAGSDLSLENLNALKLTFDDGHDSGLFTWDYLYELCVRHDEMWADYLAQLEKAGQSRDPSESVVKLML